MSVSATFYTNSFNRLPLLKNLFRSFEVCNENKDVEWVVTDYGSQDGSKEWLEAYKKKATFSVKLILGDEGEYFNRLEIPDLDRRTRFEAILRKYRNDAIAEAEGDLVFDVATDHQFVRKGDWVKDAQEVFRHREQVVGKDDLSGIIAFGYFRWRLDKRNNRRSEEQNSSRIPYYLAIQKAYVDYMVMKRSRLQQIGPYFELTAIKKDTDELDRWQRKDDSLRPETEYSLRCEKLNLKRAFLKYPILASLKNDELDKTMKAVGDAGDDGLIMPVYDRFELPRRFWNIERPVSSEEIYSSCTEGFVRRLFLDLLHLFT